MKKIFIPVVLALLFIFASSVSAQTPTGSPGCQQWSRGVGGGRVGSGIPPGLANIPITIPLANYEAGEELRFSWSVSEANQMLLASTIINDAVSNPANTPDVYTIIVAADGNHTFNFDLNFAYASGGYFYGYNLACIVPNTHTSSSNQAIPSPCQFNDDRINSRDCDNPVVIYQTDDNIELYAINPLTSEGTLALRLPLDSIETTTTTVLLGETAHPNTSATIQLWQLSTGEIQLQTTLFDGKSYIVIWSLDTEGYIRRE